MTRPTRMQRITRAHLSDARGAGRMLVDAATGVVNVVERMHRTIQVLPGAIGQPVTDTTRGITGFVYRRVRGTMRLVGKSLGSVLGTLETMLPGDDARSPGRDVFVSVVNGIHGDYLARSRNPLALEMTLTHECMRPDAARPAAAFAGHTGAEPSGKLMVLVHGLCMSSHQWTHDGHNHGEAARHALGYTPVYLRYNSGLPIAENGRLFARQLESLLAKWPFPVEELAIVGHSMGGLVARSACHAGRASGHRWPRSLTRLVFLGTPHHGAPLERAGHGLNYLLDVSPYSAPLTRLGAARSAGIQNLRQGTVTDDGRQSVPLPRNVASYAVAAVLGERPRNLADKVLGDGLVPLDSALGRHRSRTRALCIPEDRQWVAYGMGHLDLLRRPEVFARIETWLRMPAAHSPRGS